MSLGSFSSSRRMIVGSIAASCVPSASTAFARPFASTCWRTGQDLPVPLQEIYPCLHDGRIWIAGGLRGEGGRAVAASGRVFSYDPAAQTSRDEAMLPAPVHHPQLVSVSGSLWCLGGFLSPGPGVTWRMTAQCLKLAPDMAGWVSAAPAPFPLAECVSGVLSGRVHLVGGRRPTGLANGAYRDHGDTDGHLVFDPSDGRWSQAAPALTARNSAAGAVLDGRLHVVGGRTVDGGPSVSHEVFEVQTDRWRRAAPLPRSAAAGGLAAAVLGGRLFVFGGEAFDPAPGRVLSVVWSYDPQLDSWSEAGRMPVPRHGLGALAIGNALWTIGGAERPSGVGTSSRMDFMRLDC